MLNKRSGGDPVHVFTYKGKPVRQINTKAWRNALARAGIENFRWHDLRHTWASWHIQQGTPLQVLQELGGWASVDMVQRYAHLSAGHLKVYADRLSAGKEEQGKDNVADTGVSEKPDQRGPVSTKSVTAEFVSSGKVIEAVR